jgi:ferredoxin
MDAADRQGVPQADFETGEDVVFPGGAQNKRFHIARSALSAGFIVNLPKLKTHGLTGMTGALKNMFGVIPGNRKAEFHLRHPDPVSFSRMLVDLNALMKAPLAVMDAVQAMEGNGPSGGKIVEVGLLIVSRDPVAMDAVACRIMGMDPMSLPLIALAEKAGLGAALEDRIELRGAGSRPARRRAFERAGRSPGSAVPPFLLRFAKRIAVARPVIDPGRCARCGQCIKACPSKPPGLGRQDSTGVPRYNYGACIRCYCCQEICPEGAISLKTPLLGRALTGAS